MSLNNQHTCKYLIRFGIIVALFILLNILSTKFHVRFDATREKRFSLSEPTKALLKNLKETVVIEVYLKGKFPAGFQKLAESTKDVLNEFKEYGNNKVRFEFINPLEGATEKDKKQIFENLAKKGINPVNLKVQQDADEGYSEKIIFPSANVSFNHKELSVNLLESNMTMSPTEKLNYAESLLEYKLANAIKTLMQPDKKKVAYIVGNGEIIGLNTFDILTTIGNLYDLDTLDLNKNVEIGSFYDAIVIAKPSIPFDDKNKFKIDQYVMHGGKILWCIDQMRFEMDSLVSNDAGMAVDLGTNLDDMFFKYGVRINPDLIEDFQQANPIPVTVGYNGTNPDIRLVPWLYNPFSISTSKHPIVNNLDAVMFMMVSSIDTIANPEVTKTILLHSSNLSRRMPSPVRISMSNLKFKPEASLFKDKDVPMAVLLEGNFSSVYTNRLDPNFLRIYKDSLHKTFLENSKTPTRMIVVSDGDVLINDYIKSRGPLECGYYKYTEQQFANKTFILNCLEYLTDDYRILEARNKNLTLRLLDSARVKKEKLQWQLFNIGLPILLVLFFASGYFFFRRKRYEGKVS
jgi:ABC-2 type transport system permease protein